MTKKFLAVTFCVAFILTLSSCSFAEKVADFFDGITSGAGDLLPNDIELAIGRLAGKEQVDENHEIIFSEGYINMLKSGTFNMVYHLDDGTEVQFGSNGVRTGSSYPEYTADEATEDEKIPMEHIVLYEGIYYYIDDNQKKMFTVKPENYKAVPFEISVEGVALAETGSANFGGKTCRLERYTTDKGDITFYFKDAILQGITVNQSGEHTVSNITLFNKYLSTTLVSMPSSYTIVQYQ